MGRMAWGATTPRVCLGSVAIGKRLWRSRAVEKSQSRLSHRAWKSRPKRGIPTSPQPRRRRVINRQPDNSLATKTGPFNLLRTERTKATGGPGPCSEGWRFSRDERYTRPGGALENWAGSAGMTVAGRFRTSRKFDRPDRRQVGCGKSRLDDPLL